MSIYSCLYKIFGIIEFISLQLPFVHFLQLLVMQLHLEKKSNRTRVVISFPVHSPSNELTLLSAALSRMLVHMRFNDGITN